MSTFGRAISTFAMLAGIGAGDTFGQIRVTGPSIGSPQELILPPDGDIVRLQPKEIPRTATLFGLALSLEEQARISGLYPDLSFNFFIGGLDLGSNTIQIDRYFVETNGPHSGKLNFEAQFVRVGAPDDEKHGLLNIVTRGEGATELKVLTSGQTFTAKPALVCVDHPDLLTWSAQLFVFTQVGNTVNVYDGIEYGFELECKRPEPEDPPPPPTIPEPGTFGIIGAAVLVVGIAARRNWRRIAKITA